MVVYESTVHYLRSCSGLRAKIAAIDAVMAALEDAELTAATSGHVKEYWLNDGQTQIKEVYRSGAEISVAIDALEKRRNRYLQQLNKSSIIRLVDQSNFPGRR